MDAENIWLKDETLQKGERGMDSQANAIIKKHTGLAMAAAFLPIPGADSATITLIEADMLRALTKCYGLQWSDHHAKQIVGVALATTVGTTIWSSAAKLIPGVGSAAAGAVQSVIAGSVCYALGKAYHMSIKKDGEFDLDDFKRNFKVYRKEGEKVARELLADVRAGKHGRLGRRARAFSFWKRDRRNREDAALSP